MTKRIPTYIDMVAQAEAVGQIYDECGESLCQEVIDAVGERRWTGSREDWQLLREKAEELDAAEATPKGT